MKGQSIFTFDLRSEDKQVGIASFTFNFTGGRYGANGRTGCILTTYEDGYDKYIPIKTTGYSYCHELDEFDPVRGMKIALTRAVRGLDREKRIAVWGAFWDSTKNFFPWN